MSKPLTLNDWMDRIAGFEDRPAVIALQKDGRRQFSFEQLDTQSRRFASGLISRGITQSERVAFLCGSSPQWIVACLGTIRAGAVPVPLDVQFDDESLQHVLRDSEPTLILTDKRRMERLRNLQLEQSADIFRLDADNGEEVESSDGSWQQLLGDRDNDLPEASPDDPAVLFYTSGTTGPPKGVPLTHRNIATQIDVLLNAGIVDDDDRILLPLPLHHVYPFVVGMLTPLARGLPLVLPYSLTGPQMIRALNEEDVTLVIGVPRIYRALYDGIVANVESSGRIAGSVFRLALGFSSCLKRWCGLSAGKWLLRPLHRRFGPRLRTLASGGSPLDDELARRLEALGWQVAIGYGLTETSPLLTLMVPQESKIGTVGRPIANVELRIDDVEEEVDTGSKNGRTVGEIVARGPGVFGGYRNLPDKTDDAFTDDGWFRTGDLGWLEDENFLHVVGRKGTLIVTEGGENVQPGDVEEAYSAHAAIREAGVLMRDDQLVALIVPESSEIGGDNLNDTMQRAIDEAGRDVPSYQRLSDFRLTREALPRTRLGKIQRHKLQKRFEQAGEDETQQTAEPMSIEEMASDDRALLNDPAAQRTWNLLADKFADQRLTPDSSMRLDLDVDSLEWMQLSMAISREAGIELEEEAIGRIEAVRDLLEETIEAAGGDQETANASPLEDPEAALDEQQLKHLQPLGRVASLLSRTMFAVNRRLMKLAFRLRIEGSTQWPDGPIVIAPNHTSYLDAPTIAAALPAGRLQKTWWAGWTGTLFSNPLMRWFSRLGQVVPVDPARGPAASLALGASVLQREYHLVWFPEGERSKTGELIEFRPGIGLLLEHQPAVVVPVAILGAHQALPRGRWFPRFRQITVRFGDPLRTDEIEVSDNDQTHAQIAATIHEAVEQTLQRTTKDLQR